MTRLPIAAFFLFISHIITAQICGTPQLPLLERIDINKQSMLIHQRGVEKYIPITFHLVANSEGNGRVQEEKVLEQLCELNQQFADQEVTFYIDRLNYIDNTNVYETPASSAATIQMRLKRDPNSMNVFITNKAESGNEGPGQTLAYYDPPEDWIVSRKGEINNATKTLAHEIGHFFSLPHPHAGWDCKPYTDEDYGNPVTALFTLPCDGGGGSLAIELQNGSNCATAGDRICDTPPDYNMGLLHQNGCAPNTSIKDRNNEVITPITTNYMAYYQNCDNWSFTTTQKNLMNTDYFTVRRNYIRTGYVPDTDSVTGPVNYISPINGELTPGDNNILLDWEDVPGATDYIVLIDRFQSFTFDPQKYFVSESQVIIDSLTLLNTYYWKVLPYNESSTCAGYSATQNFKVGTSTGVNEIDEVNDYTIHPNPVMNNDAWLTLSSVKSFDAEVMVSDYSGHVFDRRHLVIPSGMSQHTLNTKDLLPGIYFVMIQSKSGILVERLLIMD